MAATEILVRLLITTQVGVFLGMFVALAWGLRELWAGRSLLPWVPAREVPWKGMDVLGVVFLFAVVNVAVATVFLGDRAKKTEEKPAPAVAAKEKKVPEPPEKKVEAPTQTIAERMLAMTCVNAALLVLIPLFLRLTCRATLEEVGFSTRDLARNVQLGAASFLFATPLVYVVFALAQLIWRPNQHDLEKMVMSEMSPTVVVLAFVSAVIFAPLAEELLFRSVLQGWLTRWFRRKFRPLAVPVVNEVVLDADWGETPEIASVSPRFVDISEPARIVLDDRRPEYWAIGITSVLFALAHAPQMPAPVPLFVLSVVLGVLINRTGSLVPSIVLHALFNGFSTLGLLIKALQTVS